LKDSVNTVQEHQRCTLQDIHVSCFLLGEMTEEHSNGFLPQATPVQAHLLHYDI
jgi:hypothetical protein